MFVDELQPSNHLSELVSHLRQTFAMLREQVCLEDVQFGLQLLGLATFHEAKSSFEPGVFLLHISDGFFQGGELGLAIRVAFSRACACLGLIMFEDVVCIETSIVPQIFVAILAVSIYLLTIVVVGIAVGLFDMLVEIFECREGYRGVVSTAGVARLEPLMFLHVMCHIQLLRLWDRFWAEVSHWCFVIA